MEAILLHELAHIKRYDYLINLLLSLIETVLYFNPFVRLLSHDIKRERENCCDDWVLQYQYDGAMYVSALMALATKNASPKLALYASDKKMLLSRIKRIVQPKRTNLYNLGKTYFALIIFVLIGLKMLFNPLSNKSISKNGEMHNFSKNNSENVIFKNSMYICEMLLYK